MLVGVVQFTKKKERAVFTPVPSLVWLKLLNTFTVSPIDALKGAQPIPMSFTPKTAGNSPSLPLCMTNHTDGESSVAIGEDIFLQQSKLPHQKIERRTKIVDNFTNKNTPLKGKWWGNIFNPEIIISSVVIELCNDNSIGVSFKEPLERCVQKFELAFCPLDFSSWPVQIEHMLYSNNYGRKENGHSKNSTRVRDTHPKEKGRVRRTRKGGETDQAPSSPPPPEEVKSRTAPYHHHGGYTAKHTHSGNLEDV